MGMRAFAVALGFVLVIGASRPAQPAEELTRSFVMDRLGITLHHPETWSATSQDDRAWIVNAPLEQATGPALNRLAQIFVSVEHRKDHAEAVRRLREIASEFEGPVTYLTIGGWPAMQRQAITAKEQPGAEGADAQEQQILRITTAIAAGDLLIRADGRMAPDVGAQIVQEVLAIESGIGTETAGDNANAARDIEELRAVPKLTPFLPPPSTIKSTQPLQRHGMLDAPRRLLEGSRARSEEEDEPDRPASEPDRDTDSGAAERVITGGFASEPEIAVSTDGQTVVVGQQFQFAMSTDGGLTFPTTGSFPSSTGGDTSLAYGKSGNFYEGTISNSSSALNVMVAGDNSFSFKTNAFTCPTTGPNQCTFNPAIPDQEHIAADRFNASASGGDQVYFAWRMGSGVLGVACSSDSGKTFGAASFATGDFPRLSVGQDGFVYVVFVNGGNITLNRYSSCQAGFALQTGFPVTVATGILVTCPVPGLDRCNNGNLLSSHVVAVDDANANHIYVAYAQSSGSGESVVLQDSPDGGATWSSSRAVTLSASVVARRFMSWLCTANGVANVTWYDRRAATGTSNDLTDYYGANACVTGSGNVSAGAEFQINAAGSADAQCLAGKSVGSAQSWPGGSRAPGDSKTCSEQPELGGKCRHTPTNATDSFQACNFAATTNTCPVTETCSGAGGIPKYGDYNGNACAAGRLYTVWASATPPPGQAASGNVDLYFAANPISRLYGATSSIWRYTGQPCTGGSCPGWLALDNNPASVAIAASNTTLYQLQETGAIWRSTGAGCSGNACPGWQMLDDNPATSLIIAGSSDFYQLHNDGSIWRSTGTPGGWVMLDGNPATTAIAAGDQLYQLHNDGSIWRSTGAVGGWVMLDGNPATTAIAAAGSQLYQLHNDGSIWRSTGAVGGWVMLDGNPATTAIAAGGSQLYQLHNDGSIWRSTGAVGGWVMLDGNSATIAIAAAGSQLYQLHNDGSIWRSTGGPGEWEMLDSNSNAGMIAAGGSALYEEHSALVYQLHFDGSLWRHTGPACGGGCCTGWDDLDNNAATTAVAASGRELYQLHNDGSIWRSTGVAGGWVMFDGNPATTAIAAAGNQLFQLHNDGSIWRSTGAVGGWVMLDGNPATTAIAAAGNQLFQLHNDGSIWRSTGAVGGWVMLDGNPATTEIAAAGNQLFQLHNDGTVWRSTGTPGGWEALDSNTTTVALAAPRGELYQLHNDGSIWRSTGVVGGWVMLDGNPATTAIVAGRNQLFQLHNDGSIWRSTGVVGGWVMLDGNPATTAIAAAGNQLFQLHKDGSIWRSTGVVGGWVMLDGNSATTAIVAAGNQLFQLHKDGSIWRSTGAVGGWVMLDGNPATTAIVAAGNQLFQLHKDGSIWRSTGAVGGWVMLDGNPATTAIAATGTQLFQLHKDGSIWRSTGAVGGWVMLDNNPAATAIAATGGQLFQLHNGGSIWRSTGVQCSGGACPGWELLDGNPAARSIAASHTD
jgi:hypothetical protein